MAKRKLSLKTAKKRFVNRYTMEHVPDWAKHLCSNGKYYAPQYSTDEEWYDNTMFYGESVLATKDYCFSTNQSWPLGFWLDYPFTKQLRS